MDFIFTVLLFASENLFIFIFAGLITGWSADISECETNKCRKNREQMLFFRASYEEIFSWSDDSE